LLGYVGGGAPVSLDPLGVFPTVATSFPPNRRPPKDAPEGTVWFGGPVDQATATLVIRGATLVDCHA